MKGTIKDCIKLKIEDIGRNSLLLYLSILYLTTGIIVLGPYKIFPELSMEGIENFVAWYQIISALVSLSTFVWIKTRFSKLFRALAYWTISAVGISGFVIFLYAGNILIASFSILGTILLIISSMASYKKYVMYGG